MKLWTFEKERRDYNRGVISREDRITDTLGNRISFENVKLLESVPVRLLIITWPTPDESAVSDSRFFMLFLYLRKS
jgi:hypothetical protein